MIVLFFIALSGAFYFYSLTLEKPKLQVFPATVSRSCAPWDGSAFTVTVQYDVATDIYIDIWKAPDIRFPSAFMLPDDEGQIGYAYILPDLDPFVQLSGNVFLQSVSVDKPVEGRFRLKSEWGKHFEGHFVAEWEDKIVACG